MSIATVRGTPEVDGEKPGWTGHVRSKVDLGTLDNTATSNCYAPPLRLLVCTGAGDVVFTLDGDDPADATKKVTRTLAAGGVLDVYAIKKIWSTGTTATVEGFR